MGNWKSGGTPFPRDNKTKVEFGYNPTVVTIEVAISDRRIYYEQVRHAQWIIMAESWKYPQVCEKYIITVEPGQAYPL